MKKTGIVLAMLAFTASAFAQGAINFNNRITGVGGFVTPIYGVNPNAKNVRLSGAADFTGSPALMGTNFTASIWEGAVGATDLGEFTKIGGNTTFRTVTTLPGIILAASVVTTTANSGSPGTFQVRAWDNKGGTITTWADALAASQRGESGAGYSDAFTMVVGGGPLTPPNLVGLKSFNLTIVPEPSLIALGALGFGALLLRRRK